MYHLTIEAKTKSKAKLLGFPISQYVFGQNFEVNYVLKNVGENQASPSRRFTVVINWQGTQYKEQKEYKFPRLKPGQSYTTETDEWGVLSHLGGFHIIDILSDEHPQFKLHTVNGLEIDETVVFDAVFGTPSEGVYEYWALLVSAVGLAIIAGEKLLQLAKWLITLIN